MALIDTLIPNASADVVAVFDENFNQVFENARPIKAAVNEESKIMDHPLETGATISDHQIFLPISIELSLILSRDDYRSVYQQIKQVFRTNTVLTVQTRTDSYPNMLIEKMPHDEDPELFDVIAVALSLRQADFITPQYGTLSSSKVANKSDAATVDKGEQLGKDAPASSSAPSILKEYFGG